MTAAAAHRARHYIRNLPLSVQGSDGSTALFAVAQTLVRGFDLPEAEAWPLLTEWNAGHAHPPWSDRELRHKLHDALRHSRKSPGYLLTSSPSNTSPSAPSARPSSSVATPATLTLDRIPPPASRIPHPSSPLTDLLAAEHAEKQRKRSRWPVFHPVTPDTIARIAALRRLPEAGIDCARSLGYLAGAEVDGHACYIIREHHFAQARRLDGGPLTDARGGSAKAKNLPGSEGRFIGWRSLGDPILLVEGVIGLIEAISAALLVDADTRGWTVLAAMSAGSRFTPDELNPLRGRRVRIVPDNGSAGLHAAGRWNGALTSAGCRVDGYLLPEHAKDLGDVISDLPLLTDIFTL